VDQLTPEQAEDAAASALATLVVVALLEDPKAEQLNDYGWRVRTLARELGTTHRQIMVRACRLLLRGPLDEDYSRRPGGYCMRAPADPALRELGRYGARLVELSYTARDASQALLEAGPLPEVKS